MLARIGRRKKRAAERPVPINDSRQHFIDILRTMVPEDDPLLAEIERKFRAHPVAEPSPLSPIPASMLASAREEFSERIERILRGAEEAEREPPPPPAPEPTARPVAVHDDPPIRTRCCGRGERQSCCELSRPW